MTNSTVPISSNQEIVERGLAVNKAKREARSRSVQEKYDRNLRTKRLLHTNASSASEVNDALTLYAVKIMVDEDLRRDLKLTGREKRGRVFLERGSDAVLSLRSLKFELHSFFRALRKDTFTLAAGYPQVEVGGMSVNLATNETSEYWPLESDADVERTFSVADDFFAENGSVLKRPSIVIHVQKDPNAPPPAPLPPWLQNMKNPADSPTMTMLSFYAFPPTGVADSDAFAEQLRKSWKPFEALGRVYVANEGVNAQMSVPTSVLENFIECCRSIPELGIHMENGINVDPVALTLEEFATAGTPGSDGTPAPPFRNLHVRVRSQVVADGLDKALNWQSAGYDMPPLEWHQKLKEAKELREKCGESASNPKEVPLIFDCRNAYETDVGRFEGAEPLETVNFRDSWEVLQARLSEVPKDAPIMTYCTGK